MTLNPDGREELSSLRHGLDDMLKAELCWDRLRQIRMRSIRSSIWEPALLKMPFPSTLLGSIRPICRLALLNVSVP